MKVKYNRTSTIQQEGKRFDLDKNEYDLTLFDKGVSGKIPFSERTEGNKLTQLVNDGKVSEVVVEELSRLGRNTIDTLTTLKFFEDNEVNADTGNSSKVRGKSRGKRSKRVKAPNSWSHFKWLNNQTKKGRLKAAFFISILKENYPLMLALRYSRFIRAIFSKEIPFGHSISQAPVLVQLPNPSRSICFTMFKTRVVASTRPCGNKAY